MFGVAAMLAALFAASGCYSWTTIQQAPPGSETVASAAPDDRAASACIESAHVGSDPDGFLLTFQEKLADAGVFRDVRMSRCAVPDAVVVNIVRVIETDPHVTRMVFTSMAFVLYAIPTLIPYRYDYEEELAIEVVLPTGSVRHYRSRVDGSQYHTIWAGFRRPRDELRETVDERVINDVVNQLVRDRHVFAVEPTLDVE